MDTDTNNNSKKILTFSFLIFSRAPYLSGNFINEYVNYYKDFEDFPETMAKEEFLNMALLLGDYNLYVTVFKALRTFNNYLWYGKTNKIYLLSPSKGLKQSEYKEKSINQILTEKKYNINYDYQKEKEEKGKNLSKLDSNLIKLGFTPIDFAQDFPLN